MSDHDFSDEELYRQQQQAAFKPRLSLARTPPGGNKGQHSQKEKTPEQEAVETAAAAAAAATAAAAAAAEVVTKLAEKRQRESPEGPTLSRAGKQEAKKPRSVVRRSKHVTPIAGILTSASVETEAGPIIVEDDRKSDSLSDMSKLDIMQAVYSAVSAINEIATGDTSKLNKADIRDITIQGQKILAMVATLDIRLAEAENAKLRAQVEATKVVTMSVPDGSGQTDQSGQSYATALKLKNRTIKQAPISSGPVLAVYPVDSSESATIKTAEDTKKTLKKALDPAKLNVQVQNLRKVGNAGVVIQTTTQKSAEVLRKAEPALKSVGLRLSEPKRRSPLVALRNLGNDMEFEDLTSALWEQNLQDSEGWTHDRLRKECNIAFKKGRRGRSETTIVLQCSAELRRLLVGKGRVYIGWDSIEVEDFIQVTCCRKCQMYGHPEKHCRAKEPTCGSCGAEGHQAKDCKSSILTCATCKKLTRSGAGDHTTGSKDCPARQHAESRAVNQTNYGL